ncbi:GNAT family N-acetyltransferase [Sinirhodobacter populi]|uniref:GNAT family N-acetyltransferase n=2 Tax=Paenirhodobacter populi TaxID=2306993 RepID=A0A443J876_9RHOB|nr:GNAT family N-acetyltransferase [Sinirhodobacter populi]
MVGSYGEMELEMQKHTLPIQTEFGLVRCARQIDAERIVEMAGKLAAHHGDTPTLTAHDLIRDISGENPSLYVLVAEADGELVGYVALCRLIRLQFGLRGIDMHHLFTEASFRGRGVGNSLVEASKIKANALSCGYMTVGTHPDNHKAQAFYEALGFERKDAHPPRFSIQIGA